MSIRSMKRAKGRNRVKDIERNINKMLPQSIEVSSLGIHPYKNNGQDFTHFGIILLSKDSSWGCFCIMDNGWPKDAAVYAIIKAALHEHDDIHKDIAKDLKEQNKTRLSRVIHAPVLEAVHSMEVLETELDPYDVYSLKRTSQYLPEWI